MNGGEDIKREVVRFNRLCGNRVFEKGDSVKFIETVLSRQMCLLIEEYSETLVAMSKNDTEGILDGLVDIGVIAIWYGELLKSALSLGMTGKLDYQFFEYQLFMLDKIMDFAKSNMVFGRFGSKIVEAGSRVMANNMLKFTTNAAEADGWDRQKDHAVVRTKIDDVYYFCLKNTDGKIVKRTDFPKVYLKDLVEDL